MSGGDTEDVYFRLKMSTKMVELQEAYAKRVGVPVSSIQFSLDGQDIDDDETPADFYWEEGDVIEAKKVNGISSDANNLNSGSILQDTAEDDEIQITESVEHVLSTSAEPVPSTSAEPVPSTSAGRRTIQTSENHPETEMSRAKRRRIADNDASMIQIMLELKRNNEKLTEVILKQNDMADAKSEIDNLKIQQKNLLVRNVTLKKLGTFLYKSIKKKFQEIFQLRYHT